jgi:DNA helicase-2/ATP-dependent DNA helicase PcrA
MAMETAPAMTVATATLRAIPPEEHSASSDSACSASRGVVDATSAKSTPSRHSGRTKKSTSFVEVFFFVLRPPKALIWTPIVSSRTPDLQAPDLSRLDEAGQRIVSEEEAILTSVQERLDREGKTAHQTIENLDAQMIELRDQIAEAKEEDVASLVEQMHQVAALSSKRGKGRSLPVDPKSPYFGHLQLEDLKRGRRRDVLIGKRTLLDDGNGFAIVDWRNAPISRLYYRYEEQEEYEEEFDERSLEGRVLLRRSLAVADGRLRRVATPQGTFVANRKGAWRDAEGADDATLAGGSGAATRASRGTLGVQEEGDDGRHDKRLQEITALIDKEQFGLITRPESGIVLIQGGAGSGKTTVALHRVAYLAFQDPKRFAPSRVLIMVFNEALVEYIKHVLPSLGVEGARVTTYRRWSAALLRRMRMTLPSGRTELTPEPVSRFKKHPVLISMMERLVQTQREEFEAELEAKLGSRKGGDVVVAYFKELSRLPLLAALERSLDWLRDRAGRDVPARTRAAAESMVSSSIEELSDVVSDWIDLLGDEGQIRDALEREGSDFRAGEIASIVRWCGKKTEQLARGRSTRSRW